MKTRLRQRGQQTSRGRLLAPVLLLALGFACGKIEEEAPVATQPASGRPGVAAATAPAGASSPSAATATTPVPAARTTPPAARPTPPATSATALPAAQRPKGKITLPAKLGAVTFDHEKHAGERDIACTTCHHPSRPQRPLVSERQACRDCHAMPAAPPMQTSLRAAFHDPKGATGTCIDCHRQKGDSAPVKCLECHKKK